MSCKSVLSAIALSCLGASPAFADTVYVPIDFGGSVPKQFDELFLKAARALPSAELLNDEAQTALLDAHFINTSDQNDYGIRQSFESASNNYMIGNYDLSDAEFVKAFETAQAHPEVLAISTTLADELFYAGAYWLQLRHFVQQDQAALQEAIGIMVRLFPGRSPNGEEFPNEIAAPYREQIPKGLMGHELKLATKHGCKLKINGEVVGEEAELRLYSGKYAFSKVCGENAVRVVKFDVIHSMSFTFDEGLYPNYSYPPQNKYVARKNLTREKLSDELSQLARILEVDQVVGVGYVPGDYGFLESGYTAILADRSGLIRARTAPKDDVATESGMADFTRAVFEGTMFHEIEGGHGLGWMTTTGIVVTSLGAASMIAGGIMGGLAMYENDEYLRLKKLRSARENGEYLDHADKRNAYKGVTDKLLFIGAGAAVLGAVLIVVDQLAIRPYSSDLYRAELPMLQINASKEATSVGVNWTF